MNKAIEEVKYQPQDWIDHTNWMIAGSVGVGEYTKAQSLTWDENTGINDITIWVAIGIRLKNELDYKVFLETLPELYGEVIDVEKVDQFLSALKKNKLSTCQKLMDQENSMLLRSKYALTAAIYLGEDIPDKWKFYVHRICLINEKPYLPFTVVENNDGI